MLSLTNRVDGGGRPSYAIGGAIGLGRCWSRGWGRSGLRCPGRRQLSLPCVGGCIAAGEARSIGEHGVQRCIAGSCHDGGQILAPADTRIKVSAAVYDNKAVTVSQPQGSNGSSTQQIS